jgi:hypothetical protein
VVFPRPFGKQAGSSPAYAKDMDVNRMSLRPNSDALAVLAKDIEALSRNLEQNKHLWRQKPYGGKAHHRKYRCLDMLQNLGDVLGGAKITGATQFREAGQAIRVLVTLVRSLDQVESEISNEGGTGRG